MFVYYPVSVGTKDDVVVKREVVSQQVQQHVYIGVADTIRLKQSIYSNMI